MKKSKQRPKAKLKKYPNGGKKLNPYIATDPNDPRIQNYNDSLLVSKASDRDLANVTKDNTIDYNTSMSQTMAWNSGAKGKAHARLSKLSDTGFHEAEYGVRPSYTGAPAVMKDKGYIAKYPAPKQEVIYQPKSVVSTPKAPVMPVNAPIKNVQPDLPQTVTYGKSNLGQPYSDLGGNRTWLTQGESDKIPALQYKMGGYKLPKFDTAGTMGPEYNPELDGGSEEPYNPADPNRGNNTGQYMQYGMAAANTLGQVQSVNQDASLSSEQKAEAQSGAINQGADSVAGKALPWYAAAMTASKIGRNMVKKDDEGNPISSNGRATDALMKPIHQQQIDAATKGNWVDFAGSTLGAGFYAPIRAKLDKDYEYANGGVHSGRPNAEVETIETMNTAPGSITSANSNKTHAMGGVEVNLPTGTKMLSDRIINPETKNTFAKDGNGYTTDKEDKVKDDINATGIAKFTANLKSKTKQFMHDKLFQAQEAIKQAKLKFGMQRLHKRLGIEMPQGKHEMPDGQTMYSHGGTKLPQYYKAGLTPMEVPEDPEFRSQQDWYFPNPSYNTPGFAQPKNPSSPMLTRAERDQAEWNRMDAAGKAGVPQEESESSSMMNEYRESNPGLYNKYPSYKSPAENDNSNMIEAGGLFGNVALQNAGNIWDLVQTKGGTKYDKENSRKPHYNRLNSTQYLQDADTQNKITRGALASAANGHAGSYMKNAVEAGGKNAEHKFRVRAEVDKYNAAIGDKELSETLGLERQDKANEQANKARSEDIARKAVRSAGENTSAAITDYRRGKMDQKSLDLIASAYPDYYYDKKKNGWFHKSTNKKLEATG